MSAVLPDAQYALAQIYEFCNLVLQHTSSTLLPEQLNELTEKVI